VTAVTERLPLDWFAAVKPVTTVVPPTVTEPEYDATVVSDGDTTVRTTVPSLRSVAKAVDGVIAAFRALGVTR
jgi:hypothetical protein